VPELPEVESVRRQLVPELVGRTVVDVWWDPHPAQRFSDVGLIAGRRIEDVTRRGKYLVCPLTGPDGPARARPAPRDDRLLLAGRRASPPGGHVRARLDLDDGRSLRFRDPRRFGRISVVTAGDYARDVPTLAVLGPEPLSPAFDAEAFAAALARTSAPVKGALLAQRLVAGVGNIYADEALWRARIHPASRRVGARAGTPTARDDPRGARGRRGARGHHLPRLPDGQRRERALRRLPRRLRQGGPAVPGCATPLRGAVVAQRGTTYCPRCQR
jgi:formamidopyrimidine-DNA glycosylase